MFIPTREKIIDVSIDLFSKNGYSETSVRDIAKNAEIKASSIYYFFESKEAILDSILSKYLEIVNFDKHYQKWVDDKNTIITAKSPISFEQIISYLFFRFDEKYFEQTRKMVKIICSESVRNETIRKYEQLIINSGYQYIKSVLDTLIEADLIKKCDSTKMATVLYSITYAYMHLDSIDMNYIGTENKDMDMFMPLEYIIKTILK